MSVRYDEEGYLVGGLSLASFNVTTHHCPCFTYYFRMLQMFTRNNIQMLASRIRCLVNSFVETNVVRHIVARMYIRVDGIIYSEDIAASVKAIHTRLTNQTS